MAKITRKTQKIFGGNSNQNGQFGSARDGTFIINNDPDIIQALPAWESGINAATVSGELLPALEESQGVHYVETRQIAYILQEGIPEYDSGTEYHENSIVKEAGTLNLYASLTDDNMGNPLSDGTNWNLIVNLGSAFPKDNYTASGAPTVNDDETEGYSVGSKWYYDGDIWLCVDASTGAANWVDTGVNLDDLGSAAFTDSSDYATAAQGVLADGSVQKNEPVVTASISGTYDIDFNAGQVWELTLTGDVEIGVTNPPTQGGKIAAKIIQDVTPRTVIYDLPNLNWSGGSPPDMPENAGDYIWVFFRTVDGGSSWTGFFDKIVNKFISSPQSISSANSGTLAHGFGASPDMIQIKATCLTANAGYNPGDTLTIPVSGSQDGGTGAQENGIAVWSDSINLYFKMGSSSSRIIRVNNKTTGALADLAFGSWEIRFIAMKVA